MSGFGVLAWIAIGSLVGWTMSRLMVMRFDAAAAFPQPGNRVQALAARLRAR
jgi:hypothetical protein